MTAGPTRTVDLSERRHDLRHDVPVPFASDPFAGYGVDHRLQPTGPVDLGARRQGAGDPVRA